MDSAVTKNLRALNARVDALSRRYAGLDGEGLLRPLIETEFSGRIALSSSFGAESAVLLHMVARIDPATPVLFLNTGKLFGETLRYRDALVDRLGLTGVRELKPDADDIDARDRDGMLWQTSPDACCRIRKVLPLDRALRDYDAWINGRKRFQGGLRADIPTVEAFDGRVKVNPLANWEPADISAYMKNYDLPAHPLVADGYRSIGCLTCTLRTSGTDARDGRWAGQDKTECGIHLAMGGK